MKTKIQFTMGDGAQVVKRLARFGMVSNAVTIERLRAWRDAAHVEILAHGAIVTDARRNMLATFAR